MSYGAELIGSSGKLIADTSYPVFQKFQTKTLGYTGTRNSFTDLNGATRTRYIYDYPSIFPEFDSTIGDIMFVKMAPGDATDRAFKGDTSLTFCSSAQQHDFMIARIANQLPSGLYGMEVYDENGAKCFSSSEAIVDVQSVDAFEAASTTDAANYITRTVTDSLCEWLAFDGAPGGPLFGDQTFWYYGTPIIQRMDSLTWKMGAKTRALPAGYYFSQKGQSCAIIAKSI